MGHTDSTDTQLKLFANRIRSYVNDAGAKVGDSSAKVHLHLEPKDAPLPYILLAKGMGETDPDVGALREFGELDILIRGRAQQDEPIVNALADVVMQALVGYREPGTAEHGLTVVTDLRRGMLGFADTPTADEAIELPVVVAFYSWPALLTDALT